MEGRFPSPDVPDFRFLPHRTVERPKDPVLLLSGWLFEFLRQ